MRLQAAEWFAEGVDAAGGGAAAAGLMELGVRVAAALAGGRRRLRWPRKVRAGRCAGWSGGQLERLRAALEAGPAVWGWAEDQRWTLERVTALIGRLFHVRYTLRGTSFLLHRLGFTPQVPVHRAAERDEDAIAAWRAVTWAKVRG